MRLERFIREVGVTPSAWVRADAVTRQPGGLEILFGVYRGKRGRESLPPVAVICDGVRECRISDFDGGGIRLYPPSHPAARQYGEQAQLRWRGEAGRAANLAVLWDAHDMAVGDWIPFERFAQIRPSRRGFSCRGPRFLMAVYARGLKAAGEEPQLRVLVKPSAQPKLKVLHFGSSYVVAARFHARVA